FLGSLGATVKPDSLSYVGRRQQKNMEKYQAKMAKAGNGEDLAPAVIDCWYYLSRTGTAMKDSLGDHGNYRKTGEPWDTEEHLAQDTEVLYRMINLEKKSPSWTKEQLNGISAYNAGVNTVQTDDKMDIGKTHNYVNDVDSRPRFYKKNGY
uniref:Lysozyme g n=1 Tax=Taeniopygia guttata TaxID=59729 RepID=A0A674HU50_TAEGU